MVDWQSPVEIAKDGEVFGKFMHTLLGLYIWEFVTSLDFDWQFISGKRKFKWPLVSPLYDFERQADSAAHQIFYFAGRYFLLFALIGIAIALNVTTYRLMFWDVRRPVNCQALYTYNQVFGNAAIGMASINLSLRTMAVWSQAWYIVVPLVVVILGHWSLLLHGILLKAEWIDGGCAITGTSNTLLAATFIYSMTFDFAVLSLTGLKLAILTTRRQDRSRIVRLIFDDGLIFFIVAFVANLLATIFMLINLNAVMSIIANVPAAVASTIVACRVVRRLTNYTTEGAELFNGSTQVSTLAFSKNARSRSTMMSVTDKKQDGVHVQMETFAAVGNSPPSDQSFVQYDVTGKVIKGGEVEHFDMEAQVTSTDEFKRPDFQ
ncbi:hypothetical protein A0H81_12727 [Grifola frondosa]|uniref:Uncharacterized protein n=1 Tax=Grifola frondosa TaxID=5627 RepID=A0A1C7LSJ5_GRIFR|nr:hypothetical protein A0H81_12727 [Grifola frondosa]